jgi:hypothetical protein
MAYGRLDVFWPDGLFKTFALVDNTVSVGRSTGNTIALETTTISRYHFSIAHTGEQVLLTDLESVNGTFVDGEKLKANEPRQLFGGEEIQVGHLRMIYHHIDEMPTQPMTAVDDTTQRIELQLPAFRLDVIGPDQPFSPGAHMSAELSITNTSEQAQRYRVEVTGLPPDWIRIDRPEVSIEPTDMAQVLVNFKPLRRPDSKPGEYRVTVKVSPKDNPDSKLEAVLLVRILPYAGFGMALDSTRLASGDRFKLHIHNQGSAPLPLSISGRDKADKLRYTIATPQVSLAPGQRMTIQGEVHPKSPALWGKPRQFPFDLVVRSNDAARFTASTRGYFTEKPMLPSWTPYALAGGVLVGLILLALAAVLLLQPAKTPVISSFQVNSTQVAQGQSIVLNWAATDVSEYRLSLNGTPVSQMSKDTPGVNLDTKDLSGNVVLSLIALNGGQQTTAQQTVYVYRPLGEFVFTAEPAQLVRYVVQNLTVTWSVPNAVSSHLSGLETFSNTPTNDNYGADGTISGIVGIPSQTVKLVLSAQDEAGNIQEKTLEIPVINPECVPASTSTPVTLYSGPDSRNQVVSTIQPGAIVVVDAQDSTGGWLRVQLPGGLSGWGAVAEFTCAQNFKVSDLYKELAVPTVPPATLPPSATPSPTPPPTRALLPTATTRPSALTAGTPTPSG